MMAVGNEFVQRVTNWMDMVRRVRPICHTTYQIPKTRQHGKNQQQQGRGRDNQKLH